MVRSIVQLLAAGMELVYVCSLFEDNDFQDND